MASTDIESGKECQGFDAGARWFSGKDRSSDAVEVTERLPVPAGRLCSPT